MRFCYFRGPLSSILVFSITSLFFSPQVLTAGDHVVGAGELRQALMTAAQARSDNLAKVEKFFASETARRAFKTAKIDPVKVERALPLLENEELARLAEQTRKIEEDFAAGALSNQEITYIIIALATAVLILIIVVAAD